MQETVGFAVIGCGSIAQIAHFPPCEFCWFQRVLMYPLSILTLLVAARADNRAARYLLPLPIVGAGTAVKSSVAPGSAATLAESISP